VDREAVKKEDSRHVDVYARMNKRTRRYFPGHWLCTKVWREAQNRAPMFLFNIPEANLRYFKWFQRKKRLKHSRQEKLLEHRFF